MVIKTSTLFYSFINKPNSSWLLPAELAMLEMYSTVHRILQILLFILQIKLNYHNSSLETTRLKQLPDNTFVIHTKFKPVTCQIFNTFKPLRLGSYRTLKHLPDVIDELMAQDGSTFTHIVTILYNTILKNLLSHPIFSKIIQHHYLITTLIPILTKIIYLNLLMKVRIPPLNQLTQPLRIKPFKNPNFLTAPLNYPNNFDPDLTNDTMKSSKIQYIILLLLILHLVKLMKHLHF